MRQDLSAVDFLLEVVAKPSPMVATSRDAAEIGFSVQLGDLKFGLRFTFSCGEIDQVEIFSESC